MEVGQKLRDRADALAREAAAAAEQRGGQGVTY
jgi:hypothetical protein